MYTLYNYGCRVCENYSNPQAPTDVHLQTGSYKYVCPTLEFSLRFSNDFFHQRPISLCSTKVDEKAVQTEFHSCHTNFTRAPYVMQSLKHRYRHLQFKKPYEIAMYSDAHTRRNKDDRKRAYFTNQAQLAEISSLALLCLLSIEFMIMPLSVPTLLFLTGTLGNYMTLASCVYS